MTFGWRGANSGTRSKRVGRRGTAVEKVVGRRVVEVVVGTGRVVLLRVVVGGGAVVVVVVVGSGVVVVGARVVSSSGWGSSKTMSSGGGATSVVCSSVSTVTALCSLPWTSWLEFITPRFYHFHRSSQESQLVLRYSASRSTDKPEGVFPWSRFSRAYRSIILVIKVDSSLGLRSLSLGCGSFRGCGDCCPCSWSWCWGCCHASRFLRPPIDTIWEHEEMNLTNHHGFVSGRMVVVARDEKCLQQN